ncbi:MAG: SLBB domain-containing protein, partial [Burkholderiales bacterium]
KNFDLNVSLAQLRAIQIFVVGQARRPGSYVVGSLSTLVNALFASGGPTYKGSLRRIQVKRNDKVVTEFDLYDLLLRGDKSKDVSLLPGDVIFIPPVGPLAAVSGSINVPAIYELKPRSTFGDLLDMAGGLATTASTQKVTIERIMNRETRFVEEMALDGKGLNRELRDGDVVNVYTLSPRIANAVTLRGNVAQTMRFPWKLGMTVTDVIPEKLALILPDYWIKRNEAGRPASWLRPVDPIGTAGLRVPAPGPVPAPSPQFVQAPVPAPPPQSVQAPAQAPATGPTAASIAGSAPSPVPATAPAASQRDLVRASVEINWDYAVIERLNLSELQPTLIPFNLGKAVTDKDPQHNLLLMPGDVITVFSADDIRVPKARRVQFVRLEGEFAAPGVYQVRDGETLRDLVIRVGGLTQIAYLYGAEFTRESARENQQRQLDSALARMEAEAERATIERAQAVVSKEEGDTLGQQATAQRALIARLRQIQATGRIVLGLQPNGSSVKNLPEIPLE